MLTYAFLGRGRKSRLRATVVIFGTAGFVIPAVIGAVSLTNRVVADPYLYAWPTSFLLGAGENGDPVWYIVLVFGAAILSNVGLYGSVGFVLGGAWNWIRPKQ